MPYTLNGFGTRYAGRSNAVRERGTCEFCGRMAEISSYDTRLWICALFIPVVPLGRKRILDDCSRCRRHRAMPLAEYRRLEEEVVARGSAVLSGSPGDPEAALEHLSALLAFRRRDEATALVEDLLRRFPEHPGVLLSAFSLYLETGREEEADRLLERACRLAPDNAAARRALAWRHLATGRLDQARSLIDAPGAGEAADPALLFAIANGYQERGEHFTALERLRALLARHPEVSQNADVRRAVRASEKAAGAPQTMLPPRALRLGKTAAVAAGLALLAAGVAGLHLYRRAHRVVHVVSAVPGPIEIAVDGGAPIPLAGPGRTTFTAGEGAHRAVIRGTIDDTVDFAIETPWWHGLGGQPVFVLDPGGLAAVGWEEIFYGNAPADYRPKLRLHAGRDFLRFDDVDYRFVDFPEEIQVSSSSKGDIRSRVFEAPGEPAAIASWIVQMGDAAAATDYLAAWLALEPSAELALVFAGTARVAGRSAEAIDRLRPYLTTDPIEVDFHRAYQELGEALPDREAELRAEYDALLERRPGDPAALYLRGRIEPDPERAQALHARALAIDPDAEHASRASAYIALSCGDFGQAADVLRRAATRAGASEDLADFYLTALDAARRDGELEALLEPVRSNAGEGSWSRPLGLVRHLARTDRTGEAEEWLAELEKSPERRALALFLRGHLLYASGRFAALREHARKDGFLPGHAESMAFWAALELDDRRAVGESFSRLPPFEREGIGELILALDHARRGEDGISERWLNAGLERLTAIDRAYRVFAALLEPGEPVTERALDRILLPPADKAVLLTLLAVRRPDAAALALRQADRLNFAPAFPYHLLRRFQPDSTPPALEK